MTIIAIALKLKNMYVYDIYLPNMLIILFYVYNMSLVILCILLVCTIEAYPTSRF